MKRYMKKWLCLIAMLAAIMMNLAFTVNAAEARVYDYAGLFTAEQIQSMETRIESLREKINYDVVVVTTDDARGKSAMDYANDFYDYNDFGTGAEKSGVLLLIDMDNREIYISTCGEMITILTDAKIEKTLDRVYVGVSGQDYVSAVNAFLSKIKNYVNPLPGALAIGFFTGLVISGITWMVISGRYHGSRKEEKYAYRQKGDVTITRRDDRFLSRHVSQRRIPKNPPPQSRSSGGHSSGRSSTHVSSSGRTHGGGGRKF